MSSPRGRSTTCLRWLPYLATLLVPAFASCNAPSHVAAPPSPQPTRQAVSKPTQRATAIAPAARYPINVYAATETQRLAPAVRDVPERVYVPNSLSNTVDVIDPATFNVVDRYRVGRLPQHITPSWDLRRLYVNNTRDSTLTIVDPRTARPAGTLDVADPYNLYFTPDGARAIVVAERLRRLDFYDPHSWKLIKSVPVPWRGVNHLDFSADGGYLIASTEFSGHVVRVDTRLMALSGDLAVGGRPIDVKISPDGSVFYVANQNRNGVSVVDPVRMREIAFIPTGRGAHGLCVSRDTTRLYVSNRLGGSISVIDFATRRVVYTWPVGGTPDMMQLSPDGRQLWVSNRYGGSVSVIDTTIGQPLHMIRVGSGPHGISYFPQPGRFSIGHNGVYR